LHFELSAGQAHESQSLMAVFEGAASELLDSQGEPIEWPAHVAGDKGYRADWIDEALLAMEITPVIPSKAREDRSERLVEFDKQMYRARNIVERLIGWLKECRRVFSRFEKTALNFGGMIKMAFIQRYLRLST
jgi:transposase